MKTIIAGFAALLLGTASVAALEGPGRALIASAADSDLQISNDPVVASEPGEEISRALIPPYSGTVRVKWEMRSLDGTQVRGTTYVEDLSNCERLTRSTTFVQTYCNIRVAAGIPIVILGSVMEPANRILLRNMRLHYKVVDSTGESIIYELPLR